MTLDEAIAGLKGTILGKGPETFSTPDELTRAIELLVAQHDHADVKMNPWQPENGPLNLAILGKAVEELGEGIAMLGRCIIQGIGESHPVTKEPNAVALAKEFTDITVMIQKVNERFGLSILPQRAADKAKQMHDWYEMIDQ